MSKPRTPRSLAKSKIAQALAALKSLDLPRGQQNERSALTLLSLLDLKPEDQWHQSTNPLMGITPMMEWFAAHYSRKYAPNSRETVRRFTIHQFEQAGLVIRNPDAARPINSPDNVYQIEASALGLLKTFGTDAWEKNLGTYLSTRQTLQERYAAERSMRMLPVKLPSGLTIDLSPGGQNILIREILEQFCPRFTPGGYVLCVGDAGDKFRLWEADTLSSLGVVVDQHGKMPDVVIYHKTRGWLVLVEAVAGHGPISPKRRVELQQLFAVASVGLVYVTAFLDRKAMNKHLADIAWETEVWVAESPTHLIHFNGERFLGPHERPPGSSCPNS